MGESRTAHIRTNDNPVDLASKIIGGGWKRSHLVRMLMHDIEDKPDKPAPSIT